MVGEEESRSALVLAPSRARELADVFEKNEKKNKTTSVYKLNIHERFFSLLKDEQQSSVNDIELASLGKNIKAAKSISPHKVKPKQREKNISRISACNI